MSTQAISYEDQSSDSTEDLAQPKDSFTDESQSSILEKALEEYQAESSEEEKESVNQDLLQSNHNLEVTSDSGPVIEPTIEKEKVAEVESTTSKSEKTTPSASDMTNGYLFFRMLTG